MEDKNVEMARLLVRLWNEGMRNVPPEYFDPTVELESPFSSVSGVPYRGQSGMEQWVRDIDEHFAEWHIHLEDVHAADNTVLLVARVRGRGRVSGIEIDQPAATVIDFGSDHRVTRVRISFDLEAARRAVGLAD
jgi:ketosteroid isomerase-like protein